MWFYINKNAENFRLELSLKACEEEGIKKDSYYNGIDELIRKRYLVPVREGSNIYNFYENQEPTIFEKKTVPVKTEITENGQSGKANGQTETQREQGSKGSKNQISYSVIPTDNWENPNFFRNSHREI